MSTLRTKNWLMVAIVGVALLVLGAALLMPALARASNCGGNSAALAACSSISMCFRLISSERGGKPVSISDLSSREQQYFRQVTGLSWLGSAHVLVTGTAIRGDPSGGQEIIAVCDRPFDNVPRRMFRKAPLTHAVGYADGSTGLISVEDFRRLDLRGFLDVRKIQSGQVD